VPAWTAAPWEAAQIAREWCALPPGPVVLKQREASHVHSSSPTSTVQPGLWGLCLNQSFDDLASHPDEPAASAAPDATPARVHAPSTNRTCWTTPPP